MHKQIEKGQVWKYKTRANETDSRLTIISIDEENHIVHVKLNGLKLIDHKKNEVFSESIDHLPIATNKFLKSIVELDCKCNVGANEGYDYWKLEFEKGNAGVWDVEVSEAIFMTEEVNNQNE